MFLPCPSCKAELSASSVGADGRCPYCGTKAIAAGLPEEAAPASPMRTRPAPEPPARETAPERDPAPTRPRASGAALAPGWGGLAVGAQGILHGKPAAVTGRVSYAVERPRTIAGWDAWRIRFGEGGEGWLLDREGALALVVPHRTTHAIDRAALREGALVRLDAGAPASVVDAGTAIVRGVEGEAEVATGARVPYATLAGAAWRYHLEWQSDGSLACFRGEKLEPAMLAAGFGLRVPHGLGDSAATSFAWWTEAPPALQIAMILLAIPLLAGVGMWVFFSWAADLVR